MNSPDGGPAFPIPFSHKIQEEMIQAGGEDMRQFVIATRGMSLRDWFAGMALQGCIQLVIESAKAGTKARSATEIAGMAYEQADALLQERKKV